MAFSGSGAGTQVDPYVITNVQQLQEMNDNLTSHFILGNDIDASATIGWNGGAGFIPIGNNVGFGPNRFGGTLDGRGFTISDIHIKNTQSQRYVGLFGVAQATFRCSNINLENITVEANGWVGGLVGYNLGEVTNVQVGGRVISSNTYSGGLVGQNLGRITKSKSLASVTSSVTTTGGFAGENTGEITECWSSGHVAGTSNVGGFVGFSSGEIETCFSTSIVNATGDYVGGLAGVIRGIVRNCYSQGSVKGAGRVGGLVGYLDYANSPQKNATIEYSYSTGFVDSSIPLQSGGLVGVRNGTGSFESSYWDTDTSGKTSSPIGVGKNTAEMMQRNTFVGWDFVNIWGIREGNSYPLIRAFLPQMPYVTLTEVNTFKISNQPGKDVCLATFTFNRPIQAWTVNVMGVSHSTGTVTESMTKYISDLSQMTVAEANLFTASQIRQIDADIPITAEIDHTKMYQEGTNRINIYGEDLDGIWTPYDQE